LYIAAPLRIHALRTDRGDQRHSPVPERFCVRIPFAIALLVAVAVPSLARAEGVGLRVGLEAPLYTHNSVGNTSQSYNIGDTLQPAINALLTYKADPVFGFEVEFREGFASTGGTNYSRTGTAIGPGLRIQPDGSPLYLRAALPVHVEPSPVTVGLRGAVGFDIVFAVVGIYLEGAVDTSLAGGTVTNLAGTSSDNVGPFDITTVSAGAGLAFKF
jgi:hypothetical protein